MKLLTLFLSLIFAILPIDGKTIATEKRAEGRFTADFEHNCDSCDTDVERKYYQFKSYNNEVWWALTEEEIGFIPSYGKSYVLLYSDNGTTAENKTCGCLPEWECECEVYDDVFLGLFEAEE